MEEDRLRYILSDTQKITYAFSTYSLQSVQNFKTKHLGNWSYAILNASRNVKTKAYRGLLKTLIIVNDDSNSCCTVYSKLLLRDLSVRTGQLSI